LEHIVCHKAQLCSDQISRPRYAMYSQILPVYFGNLSEEGDESPILRNGKDLYACMWRWRKFSNR